MEETCRRYAPAPSRTAGTWPGRARCCVPPGSHARTSASRSSRSPTASPSSSPATCTCARWAQVVAEAIHAAGAVPREFNTIAVDDGIAMGHGGMLYSLPSRELIADSVEYMVNAHCADALVCISNCDKITPGMLLAALRLNIPTVFVSGGPMEAGAAARRGRPGAVKLDLIDPMIAVGRPLGVRRAARRARGGRLPDLRLVLGHVHRQLDELPHRGDRPVAARQRHHARHPHRPAGLFERGGRGWWSSWPGATTATATSRCCRCPSPPGTRSRTPWRSTSRWAARPTRSCTCSPPRTRRGSASG